MARHHSAIDSDPNLGRKRTADLLRQLRTATKDLRSLKSQVLEVQQREAAARLVPNLLLRRRDES